MSKQVVQVAHVDFCFKALIANLNNEPAPEATFEDLSFPLFVTWHIHQHGQSRLRGCIGNFSPLKLRQGLEHYACASALHDRRFRPVTLKEVPHLSCAVSLLTDFEPGEDYLDWTIGTHGIWIEFTLENGRKTTSTYLPEVMVEQGWTKEEAIDSLLRKGGYNGRIDDAKRQSIQLTRYQSQKLEESYEDYCSRHKLPN
ncbi:AMMECR1 domain-containing protein [Gongronella butleri]|nr:AMMECR1 domain-containing protein [Gongronella butleri]